MKLGVVIMLADSRVLRRPRRYSEIRAMAQQAEAAGFDSIWLYDHLLYRVEGQGTTGIWECWSMLSALAEATRRVELGTLVTCNAFRQPALLAKMAVTVDEISGGRLTLGLGAGWNEAEYRAFGLPFDHRVDRFEEALQIIRPLLKEGRADFQGKYYQVDDCEIAPPGPRQGLGDRAVPAARARPGTRRGASLLPPKEGPPLMVGAFGPRMLKLTARYADLWNTCYLGQPETLLKPRQELWDACREVGRDPASLPVTACVAVSFPDLQDNLPLPEFENGTLNGTPEELAAGLQGYEQLGVDHLMFHLVPHNPQALEKMTAALKIYRGEGYQPSVIG